MKSRPFRSVAGLNQPSWPALVSSAEPEALQHHGQRGFFYFNYEGLRHRQKFAAGPVQNILREVYWKLALPAVGGAAVTMALRPARSPDKLGQAATIPEKAGA